MPTYSYRCTACENAFDVQQAFTDDALTECPACQGRLRKIFSVTGVTFNGSGFYRTDSRSVSSSSTAGSSGSTDSGSSSSASSGSGEKAGAAASSSSSTSSSGSSGGPSTSSAAAS